MVVAPHQCLNYFVAIQSRAQIALLFGIGTNKNQPRVHMTIVNISMQQ